MESKDVLDYSKELFKLYSTEEKAREQFMFAKALHNNQHFHDEVREEFFKNVEAICSEDNHQEQKLAFRKTLMENIKNMVMWQEFFKRDSQEDSKLIYSMMQESFKNLSHEDFEKQSAYFQLFSEAIYSMTQSILNRYYDQVIENNYSVMLIKAWRIYFENYFNSVIAKARGVEFDAAEALTKLKEVLSQVEGDALKGEERVYDLDKF